MRKKNITRYSIDELPKPSPEDVKRLKSLREEDIDCSDIPELDENFWNNAKLLMPSRKKMVSLRLDEEILDWFKTQDSGKGYQTHMNAVLRAYIESRPN